MDSRQSLRSGELSPGSWLWRILTDICSDFEFSDDSKILTAFLDKNIYLLTINKSSVGKVGVHYYNDVRTGLAASTRGRRGRAGLHEQPHELRGPGAGRGQARGGAPRPGRSPPSRCRRSGPAHSRNMRTLSTIEVSDNEN